MKVLWFSVTPLSLNASDNTGVEGVRKIITDARHKPIGTKYKIFILDD